MTSIFSIAVSGLNNAVSRIANATSNIVNASSTGSLPNNSGGGYTGFQPQDIISVSSGSNIGVSSVTQPRNPAYTTASDPASPDANEEGLVGSPNVDLNSELIASKEAQVSYGANAKAIKITEEMQQSLLDALH